MKMLKFFLSEPKVAHILEEVLKELVNPYTLLFVAFYPNSRTYRDTILRREYWKVHQIRSSIRLSCASA